MGSFKSIQGQSKFNQIYCGGGHCMAPCADSAITVCDFGMINERPQQKIVWIKYVIERFRRVL